MWFVKHHLDSETQGAERWTSLPSVSEEFDLWNSSRTQGWVLHGQLGSCSLFAESSVGTGASYLWFSFWIRFHLSWQHGCAAVLLSCSSWCWISAPSWSRAFGSPLGTATGMQHIPKSSERERAVGKGSRAPGTILCESCYRWRLKQDLGGLRALPLAPVIVRPRGWWGDAGPITPNKTGTKPPSAMKFWV